MKSKEEVKKWLLQNCINEKGDLDLSGLDFSDFEGNVNISHIIVKNTLYQGNQIVGKNLNQDLQWVGGSLSQGLQTVKKSLYQSSSLVDENLFQDHHTVGGGLSQQFQRVGKSQRFKIVGGKQLVKGERINLEGF